MKLYYYPISTYSQKVLIALYEKEVEFERELVALLGPEARAAYEEVYPIGKIPLLMPNDDHMVPESATIIEYLEQTYDQGTQLIPKDPEQARKTRFMERMNDFYLNDAVVTLLFQSWKAEQERDPDAIAKAKKHLDCSYHHMQNTLGNQQWFMGERFTVADCAAIPPLFYAQELYPFAEHDNIVRYFEDAKARPSYQKVLEEALPILEARGM